MTHPARAERGLILPVYFVRSTPHPKKIRMEADSPDHQPAPSKLSDRAVTVRLLLIGLAAGVLNGLLSIGGGILFVPGLIFLRGLPARVAVSTSLGTIMLMSIVAIAAHTFISGFHLSLTGSGLLIASGMAAAQLGAWLLNYLHPRWIYLGFSLLALVSSSNLLAVAFEITPPIFQGEPSLPSYILFGGLSGIISGMLGVGGGAIAMMGLSIGYHLPILESLPLSLAINITNALSGVVLHGRKKNILWTDVARLFIAALPGVAVGIVAAVWLSADSLRIVFACFFLFIGGRMFRDGMRKERL